jgi:hypothetical protein
MLVSTLGPVFSIDLAGKLRQSLRKGGGLGSYDMGCLDRRRKIHASP